MNIEIQKTVENLSSRRLWSIINTEKDQQITLISAAKAELIKRNTFAKDHQFNAPH